MIALAAPAAELPTWLVPSLTVLGIVIGVLGTIVTTLIVQRAQRRHVEAQRRNQDAQARRTEIETDALPEKLADEDRDRDLSRMQKTLDFAFGALDRLSAEVEKYQQQAALERVDRETQVTEQTLKMRQQMDEIQALTDDRYRRVMAELEEMRREAAETRRKVLAHVPWDLRAASILRAHHDPDFPDPPEL